MRRIPAPFVFPAAEHLPKALTVEQLKPCSRRRVQVMIRVHFVIEPCLKLLRNGCPRKRGCFNGDWMTLDLNEELRLFACLERDVSERRFPWGLWQTGS